MNSETNNFGDTGRINQSVAVLGGVTAQSYGVVGFGDHSSDNEHFENAQESLVKVLVKDQTDANPDTPTVVSKSVVDLQDFFSVLNLPIGMTVDELSQSLVFHVTDMGKHPELMSQFDAAAPELPAVQRIAVSQNAGGGDTDVSVDGSSIGASSSLLSFLDQVLTQVQGTQGDFKGTLDLTVQPIGSISQPALDPVLTNLQDELAGFES